jgi:hypothetical protein
MPPARRFATFDRTETPTIACFNRARTPLGIDFDKLIDALQAYVDRHVAPVWGTRARLRKTRGYVKGAWAMVFLDRSDLEDALAYHDLTPEGMPQAKVFVWDTRNSGDMVSVSASHELVEMLVDPGLNLMTTGPNPRLSYAYESADPVEELAFNVSRVPMSNFVYPSYFESFHRARSMRFDHMGRVSRPFQIIAGGYQSVLRNGRWTELCGARAKMKSSSRPSWRGCRIDQRRRRRRLRRADVKLIRQLQKRPGGKSG